MRIWPESEFNLNSLLRQKRTLAQQVAQQVAQKNLQSHQNTGKKTQAQDSWPKRLINQITVRKSNHGVDWGQTKKTGEKAGEEFKWTGRNPKSTNRQGSTGREQAQELDKMARNTQWGTGAQIISKTGRDDRKQEKGRAQGAHGPLNKQKHMVTKHRITSRMPLSQSGGTDNYRP